MRWIWFVFAVTFGSAVAAQETPVKEIVDASASPWASIGRVNFASIDLRSHCTGTLVAERVVLTAAHCLYNGPRRRWIPAQSLQFIAGYQRGTFVARSAVSRYVLDPAQSPGSDRFHADPGTDWALLVLEMPIGAEVGYLPVSSAPENAAADFAGYPAPRPHVLSVVRSCASRAGREGVLTYDCAATEGESGAPVMIETEAGLTVVAVLVAAVRGGDAPRALAVPSRAWAEALEQLRGAQ